MDEGLIAELRAAYVWIGGVSLSRRGVSTDPKSKKAALKAILEAIAAIEILCCHDCPILECKDGQPE